MRGRYSQGIGRGTEFQWKVRQSLRSGRRCDKFQWPDAVAERAGDPRTHLLIGPWVHGVPSPTAGRAGDLDLVPKRWSTTTRWCSIFTTIMCAALTIGSPSVAGSLFRHRANEWRDESLAAREPNPRYTRPERADADCSNTLPTCGIRGVPSRRIPEPVTDAYETPALTTMANSRPGEDLLTFETEPLQEDYGSPATSPR